MPELWLEHFSFSPAYSRIPALCVECFKSLTWTICGGNWKEWGQMQIGSTLLLWFWPTFGCRPATVGFHKIILSLKASTHWFRQSAELCASIIPFHCFSTTFHSIVSVHQPSWPLWLKSLLSEPIKSIGDSTGYYAMFATCSALPVCGGKWNWRIWKCFVILSEPMYGGHK